MLAQGQSKEGWWWQRQHSPYRVLSRGSTSGERSLRMYVAHRKPHMKGETRMDLQQQWPSLPTSRSPALVGGQPAFDGRAILSKASCRLPRVYRAKAMIGTIKRVYSVVRRRR